jgi:UDP-N-acetylmuramoyl-L-alanyl-D-glutamate--2,6-diaminopimelate ligase
MNLSEVAAALGLEDHSGPSIPLSDITHDSRQAVDGTLFFCLKGHRFDGHGFGKEAVAKGAAALVVETAIQTDAPQLVVASARDAMNQVSSGFFGDPSRELKVAGVTGTNGKTAVTHMLASIAEAAGMNGDVIGTLPGRYKPNGPWVPRSTPEAPDLQRALRAMVDDGKELVALEATSIGIDQGRLQGTLFAVSVFTNLTRDHFDQHRNMEDYFAIKQRIFDGSVCKARVMNIDDPWGARLGDGITYGFSPLADVSASDLELEGDASSFTLKGTGSDERVRMSMPGRFNVYNALAAAAAARALEVDGSAISQGLSRLRGLPGRLEPVDAGQPFMVFVDYAHSPDALEKVLIAAREMTETRVILVFGAEGRSDRGKRPLMGEVAGRMSDLAIITSDNPMDEEPSAIIDDIVRGITSVPPPFGFRTEVDRATAIEMAIKEAADGDVVLIAGKGHETHQSWGDREIPFDDRDVARRILEAS